MFTGIFAVGCGSFFGGKITAFSEYRRVLNYSMVCTTVGVVIKVSTLSYANILIGRMLHGFGSGVLGFIFCKSMNETVPQNLLQYYGQLSNSGNNLGIMLVGWVSILLPYDQSYEERKADESWRIVYGFTLIIQAVSYIFIWVSLKNPSLKELIKNDDREQAFVEINKIYQINKNQEERQTQDVYKFLKSGLSEMTNQITSCESICGAKYRRASLNGLIILIFHNFTGISGIYLYSTGIFHNLRQHGKFSLSVTMAT